MIRWVDFLLNDIIASALRAVRPALLLAPASFLDDTADWLCEHGVQDAVAGRDTAVIFDWMASLLGFQGIGDTAAARFAARHAPVTWDLIDRAMRSELLCPRLHSHWHFDGCGYRKTRFACAEPEHIAGCSLPLLPLRKGALNRAAVSLYLFLRDVCGGDFVGWIDGRLAAADGGRLALDRGRTMAAAVVEPLCHVVGTGQKLWSLILADLLLAGDPNRERWVAAGVSMISIDSLVHNYLVRTGILRRLEAEHRYGIACHAPGGCADVIATIAERIDAREFNSAFPACFPRFVEKAIWHFCAEGGRNICNGRRIDDRQRCNQMFCPIFRPCERVVLTPSD